MKQLPDHSLRADADHAGALEALKLEALELDATSAWDIGPDAPLSENQAVHDAAMVLAQRRATQGDDDSARLWCSIASEALTRPPNRWEDA